MKSPSIMRTLFAIGVIAGLVLVGMSAFTYIYETPYSGLLPVITFPFRQYALPTAVAGVVVLVLAALLYIVAVRRT